jgi:thioredoxin-related protein
MVSIAEDWYLNGKASWADTTLLGKMRERVEKITPNKLGALAYNMQRMQSYDDKYWNMHNVNAKYLVLIFYEPSCGHCKKEVPKLVKEYTDTLKDMGVKVFAVYTQYDKEEWHKFINEKGMDIDGWYNVWDGPYPHSNFRNYYDIYSTPLIFVLDKDKKIIAKRIGVENIKEFLEQHEKFLQRQEELLKGKEQH